MKKNLFMVEKDDIIEILNKNHQEQENSTNQRQTATNDEVSTDPIQEINKKNYDNLEEMIKDFDNFDETKKQIVIEKIEDQIKIYKDFLNYNWAKSEKWLIYLSNVFPIPNSSQKLMNCRKRFYSRNVDSKFDFKFDHHKYYQGENIDNNKEEGTIDNNESVSEESSKEKENIRNKLSADKANSNENNLGNKVSSNISNEIKDNRNYHCNSSSEVKIGITENFCASFNALLWILFFFNFLSPVITTMVSTIACVITILLELGMPKCNKEYADELKLNDYFQILLYSMFVLNCDKPNIILLTPIACQAIIYIFKFSKKYLRIPGFISKKFESVLLREDKLQYTKSVLMAFIGFYLFFGVLLGLNQGFIIIAHWIYMLFMYNNHYETKQTFWKLNYMIIRVKKDKHTPKIISYLLEKIVCFCKFCVNNKDRETLNNTSNIENDSSNQNTRN